MTFMRRPWVMSTSAVAGRLSGLACRRGRWSREGIEPLPFAFLQTRRSPTELQPPARSATLVISSRFVKHGPWHKKLNVGLRRVAGYYKPIAASTSSTFVPCAITSEPGRTR